MKICIVGGYGNMGSRYHAILKMLGHESISWDIDFEPSLEDVDRFIVATPTDTHYKILERLVRLGKPILCEKPVTKSMGELMSLRALCSLYETPFSCVMQYCWVVDPNLTGSSHYDYFKHGPDGMPWDMMQIIALSKERCVIGEDSPIWDCVINGQRLNIMSMDFAYIEMIKAWLLDPNQQPWDFIIQCHQKVHDYAEKNSYSYPSEEHE